MRKFFAIFLFLALVVGSPARADKSVTFFPELSALMLDARFAPTLHEIRARAQQANLELRMVGATTLDIGNQHWVYLGFSKRPIGSTTAEWLPYGNIVGQYRVGTDGRIYIVALYFTPAAEPPAGAGGGN